VTDTRVRPLEESEYRAAHTLFRGTLHSPPAPDEQWRHAGATYQAGRAHGAFADDTLVGTAMSFGSRLAVPGGAELPMAAVSRVGVRADWTRRGILTALMRAQLEEVAARGEPVATLRASETGIYGRFGYGAASRGRSITVDTRRGRVHPGAPPGGEVRLLDDDEAPRVLPGVYDRIGLGRPGTIARPVGWWGLVWSRMLAGEQAGRVAVHRGSEGDDGFAIYRVDARGEGDAYRGVLEVSDLHARSAEVRAGLWRFLLGVDLVDEVRGWLRPLDEPVDLLLTDPRACRVPHQEDETWLRLVDLPTALAARGYRDGDPVVLGVQDAFLPANSGHYRISPEGAEPTDQPAQLMVDADVLAMAYLGDVPLSTLADVGRVEVVEAAALRHADRLFGTATLPWCGTYF
jgi:predicted acetyltransferase